jgi:hypothetical protein
MRDGTVRVVSGGEPLADPLYTRVEVWVDNQWVLIPTVKSLKYEIGVDKIGMLTLHLHPQSVKFTCDLIKQVDIQRVPVSLVLVDRENLVYAYGHTGPHVIDVLEQGSSVFRNAGPVTDVYTHQPSPGTFVYSTRQAYVRMGAVPVGELTVVLDEPAER